jgi:haloalkane dehalogenase
MSVQGSEAQLGETRATATVEAPSLPDLNAETYPYADVQRLLDQVTYFNLYALPDLAYAGRTTLIPDGAGGGAGAHGEHGLVVGLFLHPFNALITTEGGPRVHHQVGGAAGRYESRWMFAPASHEWSPGVRPPATRFDRARSQDFVMLGDRVTFGDKQRHGFFGYGVGRTFPAAVGGELWVGAVGNVTKGFGKFEGLDGTYVFNAVITPDLGVQGNLTCRILDPAGLCRGENLPPTAATVGGVPSDASYFIASGRKPKTRPRTEYAPSPPGRPDLVSIVTPAQMSAVETRCTDQGPGGLRSEVRVGEAVANLDAKITLDLMTPAGTASSPNSFITENRYHFVDPAGREVGTITATIELGRAFGLSFPSAPGQRGLRYGGVGRITEATGAFTGAGGLVAVNSAIGIAPHVLSVLQILRVSNLTGPPERPSRPPAPAVQATSATVRERDLVLRTGERMHYREAGSADRPTILMLHGNPGYSIAWTPVMERLADVGHTIAPDLMGFGDSEKPRLTPTFFHQAEYLDQFVAGLGLRNVTLFIQDWGGALGFDHATRHRDNIRAIAFFEAILKPYESWDTFPQKVDSEKLERGDPQQSKSALARQKFQEFRADPEVGGAGWQQITEGNVFLKIFMGPLLGHPFDPRQIPEPAEDPVLGPLLAPYFRPFPTVWSRNPIWRLAREIPIAGSPPDTTAAAARYSRIMAEWDVPKLLIYSDRGPTLKEEHAQWVRQNWHRNLTVRCLDQLPGVQVTEGTHFLQQTHPDEIAGLFRDWFGKLP